jgi:hypothetical protein
MPSEILVNLFAFVLGALLGGGGAVVMLRGIVGKVKADPIMIDYLEKLYQAIPAQTLRDLLRDLAVIGDQVTDGKPN